MNIEHISVSRKGCFDLCSQQYKYRYHLKIQPEGPIAPHFIYGNIIHSIAENYVAEGGKRGINEVANDILTGKILMEREEKAPVLPKAYKNKIGKHLQNLERLTKKIGFDGKLEYGFSYDLDPPHGRKIVGFIDRLVIRGDKYFILDYKTTKAGSWQKNEHTIRKDLQLRTYAAVVRREFGAKAENIRAALYYLDNNKLVATAFNDAMLKEAESKLLKTYKQIESADPSNVVGRVGDHCTRCDFVKICPFYSVTGEGYNP